MPENPKHPSRGESTREALLDAATLVFAREGFATANLRQIAQAAGANPALIGYHFNSKEGLYLAVFQRIVARMGKHLEPLLERLARELERTPAPGVDRRQACLDLLLDFIEALLEQTVREQPAWGQLISRELNHPTAAFDAFYEGVIGRVQRALVGLVQRLRPGEEPEQTRLLVASLISQVFLVRFGRAPFMRLLGWESIGERELDAMKALIRRNVTLLALGD